MNNVIRTSKQQRPLTGVRHCFLVGSLLVALLLNGCALTKDFATVSYAPQPEVNAVTGAEEVNVAVTVTDNRAIKDKISCKKNGYGMEMAPILARNDVVEVVTQAIAVELANRGFTIAEGAMLVAVELNTFYNDFKIGFFEGSAVAEVLMNVQVKDAAGTIAFSKSIMGAHTKTGVQLTSGANAQAALDVALQDAVSKLMNDPAFLEALVTTGKVS